ncbi:putative membrane protein [Alkalihalobacillus xiaoxiensis]|uniref:Membrane protein n=1 Tax=Shouchella xiaoxiensis TaxID=766895 RepID=A0ABS2T0R3_9BACI|nr:hypothetical protein [Shouchella xiaoxiensis]MBM7840600.1 putative membrane protein [Shouchella xiaoxiensis]
MVSFAVILLLFAIGIPLLLILFLHAPLLGILAVAVICINWFIVPNLYRKYTRVHHSQKKDGLS